MYTGQPDLPQKKNTTKDEEERRWKKIITIAESSDQSIFIRFIWKTDWVISTHRLIYVSLEVFIVNVLHAYQKRYTQSFLPNDGPLE